MDSFDGAEISGLVGVYMFIKLHEKCGKKKVDLHRDVKLICLKFYVDLKIKRFGRMLVRSSNMDPSSMLLVKQI